MNRMGGIPHGQHAPVRLNVAKVRVPLTAVLAAWLGRRLVAGGWWLLRHPLAVVAAMVVLAMWRVTLTRGPLPVLALSSVVTTVLLLWRRLHPTSFTTLLACRARGMWLATTCYRYM